MENFTPWTSLAGGMLVGLSAALLILFIGKIAGISGVINGLLNPGKYESIWRTTFIIGAMLGILILAPFGFTLADLSNKSILTVSASGLLVGFGARLSNGCTSGHGIIGVGRFSKRSIFATITFMGVAMLTVYIARLLGGF